MPASATVADRRDQAVDDHRREPERQLVDEHEPRPRDERLGEHDHLLLAARQRARGVVEPLLELGEQLERALRPASASRARQRVRGDADVVLDGQLGQQPPALGDDRDARPCGSAPGRLPASRGSSSSTEPPRGLQHAADREHQARLAGAVGTEQRGDLAGGISSDTLAHDVAPAARDDEIARSDRGAIARRRGVAHATSSVPR